MNYRVRIGDRIFEVVIEDLAARPVRARVEGEVFEVWPEAAASSSAAAETPAPVDRPAASPSAPVAPPPAASPAADGRAVLAPIPGVIVSVAATPGAAVAVGQELCVLEAMKMKSPIRANRAGTIAAVHVTAGQQVKHRELLVTYAD